MTVCDAGYWASSSSGRPFGVVPRQIMNLNHAKSTTGSDWLVHVDADEFLIAADMGKKLRLSDELATVPVGVDWVRIRNLERVLPPDMVPQTIFDSVFRRQSEDAALIRGVYGPPARFLNKGFSGHVRGKIGIRTATKLMARLHDLANHGTRPREKNAESVADVSCHGNGLASYFEGWTALNWTTKLLRFLETEVRAKHHHGRQAAIREVMLASTPQERLAIFGQVQMLSQPGFDLMKSHDLIVEADFGLEAVARETFPQVEFDFQTDSFNQRLIASTLEFYQKYGFV